jgi:hypothetical protein
LIEITENTLALWYVELPGGNWTAMLYRVEDGRPKLECRFRWYRGAAIWDSDDDKNFYSITPTDTDSVAASLEKVRLVISEMKKIGAGKSYELLRGTGTLEEYFEQFLALPFVHARDKDGKDLKTRGTHDAQESHARRN